MSYQLRPRGAGRLPSEYDGPGAFGFWSTLSTPPDDARYGDRAMWKNFVSWFRKPKEVPASTTIIKTGEGHDYLSTACFHGLHERCRKECKFCGQWCKCKCHRQEAA